MGQAKARGSKDQRVAEAVERKRLERIAADARDAAKRKALAEAAETARVTREKENEARLERGEKPLPQMVQIGRRSRGLSTLLAAAGIAMLAQR
jgi:hypothetical protein